jgi:hypothetical protein
MKISNFITIYHTCLILSSKLQRFHQTLQITNDILPMYENKTSFLQETEVETIEQQRKRREISHRPKPEEQAGMPQHQHCPLAKRREEKNPKYHE